MTRRTRIEPNSHHLCTHVEEPISCLRPRVGARLSVPQCPSDSERSHRRLSRRAPVSRTRRKPLVAWRSRPVVVGHGRLAYLPTNLVIRAHSRIRSLPGGTRPSRPPRGLRSPSRADAERRIHFVGLHCRRRRHWAEPEGAHRPRPHAVVKARRRHAPLGCAEVVVAVRSPPLIPTAHLVCLKNRSQSQTSPARARHRPMYSQSLRVFALRICLLVCHPALGH